MTEITAQTETATRLIDRLVTAARNAQMALGTSHFTARQMALREAAQHIRAERSDLLAANKKDLAAAVKSGLSDAFIDRLTLTESRIEDMAVGLETIATQPDPIGAELARWQRPNGLDITRQSTPLGVIGVIYESRPNVTIDAAGLCVLAGNAVILRGGSDSQHSAALLGDIMTRGLEAAGLPRTAVQMVPTTDRAAVGAMLGAVGGIDVIIPRGGKSLVERVQREARVPVFAHLEGICHIYIDKYANLDKARTIVVNAKMRRTGICGAAETLLVHQDVAADMLPAIAADLQKAGCLLRGDSAATSLVSDMQLANDDDWRTEYLDAILSVRIVDSIDMAIDHIAHYGSGHTESIITESDEAGEDFLTRVDSAIVMRNASTQFADGGEFGMGAEIGIATGRLHARGPVGTAQLTSFKYVVRGDGQIRS
ncbi:MAG: glutamate-5-semialdehyde dehydrogenase [Proteobacteria bacterium]|nr:glutamate-5-semialdehyde dehydrogenase [Pseudomonadota bacterium]MDA0845116.1 glutamate-5-semialdehyde dehydrogenase [Pseudomonadota bacterium]